MSEQIITIRVPSSGNEARPEFVRLPANGKRETYTSLSRSTILRLIASGRVETKVLKTDPSKHTGARLIRLSSLLAAIESGSEAQ
jgi:hypothetical protein